MLKEVIKNTLSGKYIQIAKDKVRFALTFDPTDPDKLSQQPPARDGYRFPAPGSIKGARIPVRVEDKDGKVDPYDVKAYTYDPRNVTSQDRVFLNTTTNSNFVLEEDNIIKLGKVGAKDAAVLNYDSSGLRAVHTAGWENFEKEMKSHIPDHLIESAWQKNDGEAKLNAECERKNIPYAIGKRYKWNNPDGYNTYRW